MIPRSSQTSPRTGEPRRRLNGSIWLLSTLSILAACGGHHAASNAIDAMQVVVTDGSVRLEVGADDCPQVTVTASPDVVHVGDHVAVGALASDDDENDHLTYAWTASAGAFANATGSATSYTCPGAGPQTLTVAVSDGTCTVKRSATITCYAATDAGSGGGGAGGAAGGGAVDGGVDALGGQGGAGDSGVGGAGGACAGDDPTKCEGELCNQCTFGVSEGGTDLCDSSPEGCFNCDPGTMGCDLYASSGPDLAKCLALYTCVRDNNCFDSANADPFPCFCGINKPRDCLSTNTPATGPCVQQFIDAAKSSDPGTINMRFIDPTYPIGGAMNLAVCRGTFCGRSASMGKAPSCPLW